MLPIFSNSSFSQQYPLIDSNLASHCSYLVGFKFIFTWPAFIYNSDSVDVSIILQHFLFLRVLGLVSTLFIGPSWWISFMGLMIRSWEERILIYFNDKWFTGVNKSWEKFQYFFQAYQISFTGPNNLLIYYILWLETNVIRTCRTCRLLDSWEACNGRLWMVSRHQDCWGIGISIK